MSSKKIEICSDRLLPENNWASEASPTLGCSNEISRDIYIYMYICRYVSYVKLTAKAELRSPRACSKSFLGGKD